MYKTAKPKKPVEKVLTVEKKCGNIIKLSVIPIRKNERLEKKLSKESGSRKLQHTSFTICSKEIYKILIDKGE